MFNHYPDSSIVNDLSSVSFEMLLAINSAPSLSILVLLEFCTCLQYKFKNLLNSSLKTRNCFSFSTELIMDSAPILVIFVLVSLAIIKFEKIYPLKNKLAVSRALSLCIPLSSL